MSRRGTNSDFNEEDEKNHKRDKVLPSKETKEETPAKDITFSSVWFPLLIQSGLILIVLQDSFKEDSKVELESQKEDKKLEKITQENCTGKRKFEKTDFIEPQLKKIEKKEIVQNQGQDVEKDKTENNQIETQETVNEGSIDSFFDFLDDIYQEDATEEVLEEPSECQPQNPKKE